jgi:UDP-N-acetylglucosamine--N-acetylmuramyl-(pentapeptide) pyrophosphoryl-undecaprenol N-acetylglucosamine transferase
MNADATGPDRVWAVIAGGGTAGHVMPAVAIGKALVERGHRASSVVFVGSARGVEATIVPSAGFKVVLLPGRGIARRLSLESALAAAGIMVACLRAVALLRRLRPKVVVSVGGYASFPCAMASILLRVPLVVAEQNAKAGLANRIAGRFARASAVAFDDTNLPRRVLTGNPLRPELASLDRSPAGRATARAALGLPSDAVVVAVMGGSLGSRTINKATIDLARIWRGRQGVALRHVSGQRDFDEVAAAAPPARPGGLVYQLVAFEERMDLLLGAADVAVARAGASTVSELAAAGLPAILVPLPDAPGDHQAHNARWLADAGAAVVIDDTELTADRLACELDRLLADGSRREAMAQAASQLGRPDAANAVAALVEEHARG